MKRGRCDHNGGARDTDAVYCIDRFRDWAIRRPPRDYVT